MKRLVVDYIKEHPDTWKADLAKIGIRISDSHPKLMLLKYGKDNSDFSNPIVRECRGLVLEKGTLDVVSVSFDKFFNLGEPNCAEIDWPSAKVTQKMDGSLVTLFWYDGKWDLKTNGAIDARDVQTPSNPKKSLYDLFLEAERKQPIGWDLLNKDECYSFELMAPENRVIIEYPEPMIRFLMARNRVTGEELDYSQDNNPTGVVMPMSYPCHTLQDCLDMIEGWDHDGRKDIEGFVVCDKFHRRMKIKTRAYVTAHYLRGEMTMTVKNAIKIIRDGDETEFVTYSPWRKEFMADVRTRYEKLVSTIGKICDEVGAVKAENGDADPREVRRAVVALVASRPAWSKCFYFAALDGKIGNQKEYADSLSESRVEAIIENEEFKNG